MMNDAQKNLLKLQHIHGFDQEAMDFIDDMVKTAADPVGAMGNDTAPAIFSNKRRPLTDYKKQNFAQITNPSIHPYTEADVMSLETTLGTFKDIDGKRDDKTILDSPVITSTTLEYIKDYFDPVEIDCTFEANGTYADFTARIERIKYLAERAAKSGKHIILSNAKANENHIPFEMDMIGAAVHLHLLDKNLRGNTSLHAKALEARTTHDIACLIGDGFDTVNPYLVEHTIAQRHAAGEYESMTLDECFRNYFKAADFGLLAIMAKMGICTVSSYRGAFQFEAFGLGREYIKQFAPGVHSEIGGRELPDFHTMYKHFHIEALENSSAQSRLPHRAIYGIKHSENAEDHANIQPHIQKMQQAVQEGNFDIFMQYAAAKRKYNTAHPTQVRDLWDVEYIKDPRDVTPEDLEGVESIESIVSKLGVASMSFGSTSPEQHRDTEEGARMAGAKWQSGEGGLPPDRKTNEWSGKGIQVASGRFGIDIETVANASELEIKIAQAAKGGEGGQLPGAKVSEEIAQARNCEPGTPLNSMGAHASIKSIEDLAQLVQGLKEANPKASVAVKLVAAAGIDTVTVGAIKCGADRVNISGTGGGTGAAKKTSMQHTSMPWELYLPKAHKMAVDQGFREKAVFSTDGGLSTPQDLAIAAILGAEEFNFGKIVMYALNCSNMGICNENKCARGNATMDKGLRENYSGKPEYVTNFFRFMAEGLRREMAALGVKSLDELRGRVDLIKHARLKDRGLDFSNQLTSFDNRNKKSTLKPGDRNEYVDPQNPLSVSLDERLYRANKNAILDPMPWQSDLLYVTNQNRNIGTRLSYYLTKEFEGATREDHAVTLNLEGIGAGQMLGFLLAKGITIKLAGSANDGVGEGNSGGIIAIQPKPGTRIFENSNKNSIVGNHALYGAIAGETYLAGQTGTNHAFRYSGGIEINEGVGANAYRFMTGGTGICLGTFGPGMFAGAGGGIVYIYDPNDQLEKKIDPSMKMAIQDLSDFDANKKVVFEAIRHHVAYTGSKWGDRFLQNWGKAANDFKIVAPKILHLKDPSDTDIEKIILSKANIAFAPLPDLGRS